MTQNKTALESQFFYHGSKNQNWVLVCSCINKGVFSDTLKLQMLCSMMEFISFGVEAVEELPLKAVCCSKIVPIVWKQN